MNDDKLIFSSNLKRLRKSKGMDQIELATLLGVSQPAISEWENANKMPESIGQVKQIADIFNVSLDELLKPTVENYHSTESTKLDNILFSKAKDLSDDDKKFILNIIEARKKEIDKELGEY